MERIRNFVIISHVDHGKSTLADRFLELTGTVEKRKMREQFLDQMDLERERGITIKMQPVRMVYQNQNSKSKFKNNPPQADTKILPFDFYILNLIDTPGHADFTYEVSRALAAVEGAILLVDATQGIQAQTVANLELARREGLALLPAVNKIDLPAARVEEVEGELVRELGCDRGDVLKISAKTGEGVAALLEAIVGRIPPPRVRGGGPTRTGAVPRALIFDSHFDPFHGIIAHVRVFEGLFQKGDSINFIATERRADVLELGYFSPALQPAGTLGAGEIGYIATGLKQPEAVRVGDTVVNSRTQEAGSKAVEIEPLPGYEEPRPVVFASFYPEDPEAFEKLRESLAKAQLNDGAISFAPESSPSLGRGFRVGCLGMLHLEIAGERLRREYGLAVVVTSPSVAYRLEGGPYGEGTLVSSAARVPDGGYRAIAEPWARVEVYTPQRSLGAVMELLRQARAVGIEHHYRGEARLAVAADVPLADILADFSDALKRVTEGYGSFRYELVGYRPGDLVRLDILIADRREEALSRVVPRDRAYREGRAIIEKLKALLPRQLFAVSIQAAAAGRILARETLPALKKDVTGYLYGGDRTRKMKLWKKQKRGKARLEIRGRVVIPSDVFLQLLRR
ncbi:MAG: translation elongation factor 4 [Patescibacteria group bacterium]